MEFIRFIKRVLQKRLDMNRVNLAYAKLYKLKEANIKAANDRDDNEEQATSLTFSVNHKKYVGLYRLSNLEKSILDQKLNNLNTEGEKCIKAYRGESR